MNDKSRMNREVHVRFRESIGVKYQTLLSGVIIAVGIVIAGILIANAIHYGFESLQGAVSYLAQLLR
ncbi:MAG: hypothetical protein JG770_1539 [Mahella sp.]|nr:hypothetical protein [Mahella sp.]